LFTFQIWENIRAKFLLVKVKKTVPFAKIEVLLMQKNVSVLFSAKGRKKKAFPIST